MSQESVGCHLSLPKKLLFSFQFSRSMGLKFSRSTMANTEIQNFIKNVVSQDKVVVFSKSYCPYCKLAKEIFQKINQPVKVIELDEREDGNVIQDNLAQITGFRTVPQVFVNGKCIGGGSDVQALHKAGKLEPMLIG